jgi:hypothetical protein
MIRRRERNQAVLGGYRFRVKLTIHPAVDLVPPPFGGPTTGAVWNGIGEEI